MSNPNDQETSVPIQLPPEVQRGVYANQLLVSHTQDEFMLDFIFASRTGGTVNARVVVAPANAKRFLHALAENIRNYEKNFGPIEDHRQDIKPHGTLM